MSHLKPEVAIDEEPVMSGFTTRLAPKDVGINKSYVGVRRIKTPKPLKSLSFGKGSTDIESEDFLDDDVKDADFLTVTDSINDRVLLNDIVETRMEMRSSKEDADLTKAIEKAMDTSASPQINRTLEQKIALTHSHRFVQINCDTGHIFISDVNREDEEAATKAAAAETSVGSISRGLLSKSLLKRVYCSQISMREVSKFDLDKVIELEQRGYPIDEAASKESLYYRFIYARPFFKVFENTRNREIIGFVCGTVFKGDLLSHDAFTDHAWAMMEDDEDKDEEKGDLQLLIESSRYNLCIHSVVIRTDLRRQGFGKFMVNEYMNYIHERFSPSSVHCHRNFQLKSVRLLCKEHLIRFYQQSGQFVLRGQSDIVHGKDPWFEMIVQLV